MAAAAALELPVERTVEDEAVAVAVVTAQAVVVTTVHAHPRPSPTLPQSCWLASAITEWTVAAVADVRVPTRVKFDEAVTPWSRRKRRREAAHTALGLEVDTTDD